MNRGRPYNALLAHGRLGRHSFFIKQAGEQIPAAVVSLPSTAVTTLGKDQILHHGGVYTVNQRLLL